MNQPVTHDWQHSRKMKRTTIIGTASDQTPVQRTSRTWKRITDTRIRHRWTLVCGCHSRPGSSVRGEWNVHVGPDSYGNGIPICEECGADRKYTGTQILI